MNRDEGLKTASHKGDGEFFDRINLPEATRARKLKTQREKKKGQFGLCLPGVHDLDARVLKITFIAGHQD
jgi:hypothetical protein